RTPPPDARPAPAGVGHPLGSKARNRRGRLRRRSGVQASDFPGGGMLFSSYTVAPDFARALVMGLLGLGVSSVGVALLFREFRLDLIGVRVPGRVVGIQGGRMSEGGGGGGGGGYKMPYSA